MRTKAADEKVFLTPKKIFTVEEAISYIRDDEVLEITPSSLRIRKFELDKDKRKKMKRDKKS